MDGSVPLLLAILVLILLSAFFASTETAFSSVNYIKLKNLANSGNKKAKRALDVAHNYDNLLSTILVANNIVNITMASLGTLYFAYFFPQNKAVTISTIVITIVVLIFGEVTPKSLAKEAPESFAMTAAPVIQLFITLFYPINLFFKGLKKLLSRIFHFQKGGAVTEEDLLTIVSEAQNEGGIDEDESEIIRSAIVFNDQDVFSILTPRVDIVAVDESDSNEEIYECFRNNGYTRLPVYRENLDDIIGIINQKDFYEKVITEGQSLSNILMPPKFVTLFTKISDLMKILQAEKCHMAVAVDEYGGTAGIITLEDILEELVGEIWDEHDEVEEDIRKISDDEYSVSSNSSIDKLLEYFHIDDESDSATVGGWVMEQLEKIPEIGDSFVYHNLSVTVTELENKRLEKIRIKVLPKVEDDDEDD